MREGGCGCGAVRYRIDGDPIFVNNCHCRQCQQQTGSTSVVNAFFDMGEIALTSGTVTEHVVKGGSGNDHIIVRCAACGVALWSHYARMGRLGAGVRVGTLDDHADIRPDAAIYLAEKMPWVTPPTGIPGFEGAYNPAELLPPERFARLKALAQRARDESR